MYPLDKILFSNYPALTLSEWSTKKEPCSDCLRQHKSNVIHIDIRVFNIVLKIYETVVKIEAM